MALDYMKRSDASSWWNKIGEKQNFLGEEALRYVQDLSLGYITAYKNPPIMYVCLYTYMATSSK